MSIKFAIGNDNFAELITLGATYIDKTLWIKGLIEENTKVFLFPRPRRFGKTLNMSMLRSFLDSQLNHAELFKNLAVTQHPDIMAHQGQYPVIFITLKEIKATNWITAQNDLRAKMQDVFLEFAYLKESLLPEERDQFERSIQPNADLSDIKNSLKRLSTWLEKYHQQKVWILIDEYDRPLQEAWQQGFYEEMKSFMQGFLGAALKTNSSLYKAVLTGVLRISKEGLFSDLNNIKIYSMLSENYGGYFGFTDPEVDWICQKANLPDQREAVRTWYNGYQIGTVSVYNPWSIINFATARRFESYWNVTGNSQMIADLIARADVDFKSDFEILIQGGSVLKPIDERISFPEVDENINLAIWSFLLFAGYLKTTQVEFSHRMPVCTLAIPNQEILGVYQDYFQRWITQYKPNQQRQMLKNLLLGNIAEFQKFFGAYLRDTISYFDVGGHEPEKFYHALVLGMLVCLSDTHTIKSNRESGFGRYDVMIIPKDISQLGLIIEFKTADSEETMVSDLDDALNQINQKNYQSELETLGITNILKLAMVFFGKRVVMKYQNAA